MRIHHLIPTVTMVLLVQVALPAIAAEADNPPKSKASTVVGKTTNAIGRGANRAGKAIGRGATKTGNAIERGAKRTSKGIKRGAAKVGLKPAAKSPPN